MNIRKTKTVSVLKRIRAKRLKEAGKAPGTPTGVWPRSVARSVAKANMRRAGVQKINRKLRGRNWLRWISPKKPAKKRSVKIAKEVAAV